MVKEPFWNVAKTMNLAKIYQNRRNKLNKMTISYLFGGNAKIVKIVEVLVDLQMRWQRVLFESGDFDENQEFGENGEFDENSSKL